MFVCVAIAQCGVCVEITLESHFFFFVLHNIIFSNVEDFLEEI